MGSRFCFGNNDSFLCLKRSGTVTHIRRAFDSAALRSCLDDFDTALSQSRIVKNSRSTKAGIARLDDGTVVFLKKYNTKGVRYLARHIFRQARPFRVWQAAWVLENAGVRTPKPIAAVAVRTMRLLTKAYLVTEAVADATPDDDFYRKLLLDESRRREFISRLAFILAKIHDAGVIHSDCKLSNFYFPEWRSGTIEPGVWDLDGTRCVGTVSKAGRVGDVSRAVASVVEKTQSLGGDVSLREVAETFSLSYAEHSSELIAVERLM